MSVGGGVDKLENRYQIRTKQERQEITVVESRIITNWNYRVVKYFDIAIQQAHTCIAA